LLWHKTEHEHHLGIFRIFKKTSLNHQCSVNDYKIEILYLYSLEVYSDRDILEFGGILYGCFTSAPQKLYFGASVRGKSIQVRALPFKRAHSSGCGVTGYRLYLFKYIFYFLFII
jgi:hypothetical protein